MRHNLRHFLFWQDSLPILRLAIKLNLILLKTILQFKCAPLFLGLSEENLVINGTSIVHNLGAKPKEKSPIKASMCVNSSNSSIENSSSNSQNIEKATEQFSELKVQPSDENSVNHVEYIVYENELQMPCIMRLIQKDLSEPYSIYTYRYFIHNWPHLCFMVS